MTFSAVTRFLGRSALITELLAKLHRQGHLYLNGAPRLPRGLVASALSQSEERSLLVVTATLEEAGRWAAQLEAMGWPTVHFYPTSEASPYEAAISDEMMWGQMQVLADLVSRQTTKPQGLNIANNYVIVTTERALQPHLPPLSIFGENCLVLQRQQDHWKIEKLERKLVEIGYERVTLVESEGQWSRRGDIVDIFPVTAELPVRLEWFGDELENIREFDPSTQRSRDRLDQLFLTPANLRDSLISYLPDAQRSHITKETGLGQILGLAFDRPCSILDYLPANTIIAIDELEHCQGHGDRWFTFVEESDQFLPSSVDQGDEPINQQLPIKKIHRTFAESLAETTKFERLFLSELADVSQNNGLNLASRMMPAVPHQFGKLADSIKQERDRRFAVFIVSAQPSRSVSLLQEHDCPAKFIPSPKDYQAIDKLLVQQTPVALKYSGIAELEGFILPTFRLVVVTDREFYGQRNLVTPTYVRKRRQTTTTKTDVNKLRPGDYVVHRHHGIGKFIKLENLAIDHQTREYLVIKYADGLLRVVADQVGVLSRFKVVGGQPPELNKLTGKTWENTKNKIRKAIRKLAVDLLNLYAKRSQQVGFAFPPDSPWQTELEESFAYQPTPDQLKATQEVKIDMESDRPMDRLVCGDVGFGKTEVAIRAIFKAIIAGKQVAFLAPTTILTQQHYHTLKERFSPYPIEVALLNRFRTDTEKKEIMKRLAQGEIDVIVGTQALLAKTVEFKDLGLLVIDEEQRFGVNQKEKIKSLKTQVDVLTLSATPIPRTLYMSLSGIREMSLILTPPPNRRPIQTHLSPYNPQQIKSAIRQELDRGGQIFYVVPRIEGIEEIVGQISQMVPSARVAIAHGRMEATELETIMLDFSSHEFDILVCTTIVESGLDIPSVNTIIIEDAHKFGLAQLYQLRGRVGRAGIQAHAWLFYPTRGKDALSENAQQRLKAIQEFTQLGSGYQLAMRDLEIRGAGELLGAEQSGNMHTIGFDLYVEMLQEALQEIKGQEIPEVDDTQIELPITAFIPADYITDLEQKMSAYRAVAAANNKAELEQIENEWSDRYGQIPVAAKQLLRVMELKQIAKKMGFSKIKLEAKQHIILETKMEEPGWNMLKAGLPEHLHSRFVFSPGKLMIRGLATLSADKQLESLIDWLRKMLSAIPVSNPNMVN